MRVILAPLALFLGFHLSLDSAWAWSNGPAGNASTDEATECSSPPYSTHDWIADHALALLPSEESAWLTPHKTMYLLGTEAPDNNDIPTACGAPDPANGYDDRSLGHSVEWNSTWSEMTKDRAARRAQEEYDKAALAFDQGNPAAAAYYLGAMAHYIGDASQYGHCIPSEQHHGDYEGWAKSLTTAFTAGHFEDYIEASTLVRRRAYTAVKRICKVTGEGKGEVLSAQSMDARWSNKDQTYLDSVGHSLNLGVNELADVLHTFHLNVVAEDDE